MNFGTVTVWYARQSPRDRLMLRIGAFVVGAILLFWLVLLPQSALSRARENAADQQRLLDYMRQVGPTLAAAGPGTALQPISESFVVLIDRTAREHGLAEALTGSPPAGNGAFRVSLEGADFNLMLTWLQQLATRHGVRVESASVNGSAAPGKVNASVQLRPPG
jgi:type II secretory pathway component PulM